jgi:hypothetical protein
VPIKKETTKTVGQSGFESYAKRAAFNRRHSLAPRLHNIPPNVDNRMMDRFFSPTRRANGGKSTSSPGLSSKALGTNSRHSESVKNKLQHSVTTNNENFKRSAAKRDSIIPNHSTQAMIEFCLNTGKLEETAIKKLIRRNSIIDTEDVGTAIHVARRVSLKDPGLMFDKNNKHIPLSSYAAFASKNPSSGELNVKSDAKSKACSSRR